MSSKSPNGATTGASPAPPSTAVSGVFHLSLLGPFLLAGPDGQALEIASKKNRLLLAMLATAPGRGMSRDALAGALWAEHSEEQAKNSLRQALAVLRRDLTGLDAAFFASLEATVALHPDLVALDTDSFLRDVRLSTRESLQRAIDQWRGPFLADLTASETGLDHWLMEQREHYNRHYIAAMDRLIPLLDGPARTDMARRLVQADNLREASHRLLMEAYYAAGERSQALRHYDKVRTLLREELGVDPSPEIEELRRKIVANGHHGNGAPAAPVATASVPVSASAAAAQPQPSPSAPQANPAASAPASRRTTLYAIAAVVVLVVTAGAGWFFTQPAPEPVTKPSVAILPFQSLSGGAEDARIAEALTVDTITDLSRYWDFRVMAKDTTDAYKEAPRISASSERTSRLVTP